MQGDEKLQPCAVQKPHEMHLATYNAMLQCQKNLANIFTVLYSQLGFRLRLGIIMWFDPAALLLAVTGVHIIMKDAV